MQHVSRGPFLLALLVATSLLCAGCKKADAGLRPGVPDLKGALVLTDAHKLESLLPSFTLAPLPEGLSYRMMSAEEFAVAVRGGLSAEFKSCALRFLGTDDPMEIKEILRLGSESGAANPEAVRGYLDCIFQAVKSQR